MNPRERFVKTLKFEQLDRIYYSFGPPRKSTLEAWKLQGLPEMPEVDDYECPEMQKRFDPHSQERLPDNWHDVVQCFRSRETPLVMVDSDGHIGQMIPLWIEAGIDGTYPFEIAADNEPLDYRRKYGKNLALWGCIDKREIRSKERTYLEVMSKVPQLVEQGGFMPAVDRAVPPDDPLPIERELGPIQRLWGADFLERAE